MPEFNPEAASGLLADIGQGVSKLAGNVVGKFNPEAGEEVATFLNKSYKSALPMVDAANFGKVNFVKPEDAAKAAQISQVGKIAADHMNQFRNNKMQLGARIFTHIQTQNQAGIDNEAARIASAGKLPVPPIGTIKTTAQAKELINKAASTLTFGANYEDAQRVIHAADKLGGYEYAQQIKDMYNVNLHLSADNQSGQSALDRQLLKTASMVERKTGERVFTGRTSPYKAPNTPEKIAHTYATIVFAPLAALSHSTSLVNLLLTDRTATLGKLLSLATKGGTEMENLKQYLLDIGTLEPTMYREALAFEKAKKLGFNNDNMTALGKIVFNNYQIPGMNRIMATNRLYAGVASKLAFEDAVGRLASENTRTAEAAAHEISNYFGINPNKLANQGFNIQPEDLRAAILRGIDHRIIDPEIEIYRPEWARRTPLGRTMGLYRNWALREARLIYNTGKDVFMRSGDPVEMAKYIATIGLIFPNMGNALKTVTDIIRDPFHATERFEQGKDREKEMFGLDDKSNPIKVLLANLEASSHVAGLGVASGMIQGATRFHLLNTIAGAPISAASEIGQDFARSAFEGDSPKPLLRDLSNYGLPWVGKPIAHKFIPTAKEEAATHSHKYRKPPVRKKPSTKLFDASKYLPK